MTDHPQARREGLITQELADELMVYDVDSNEAHCLNAAAAQVWRRCDGEASVDELAAALEAETDQEVATDVVRHALDQLSASGLLEEPSLVPSGITRRQLVHRVGIAAASGCRSSARSSRRRPPRRRRPAATGATEATTGDRPGRPVRPARATDPPLAVAGARARRGRERLRLRDREGRGEARRAIHALL